MNHLNENGWIYIAMDLKCTDRWKIGMTNDPDVYKRIRATGNPDYWLVRGYAIPIGCDVVEVEEYIHYKLVKAGIERLKHQRTRKYSEWFKGDFKNVILVMEYSLRNILSGLLSQQGRGEEYVFFPDLDYGDGVPFETLIYDEVIHTFFKDHIPLSQYSENHLIASFIRHVKSNCAMPSYTTKDICEGNFNTCEEESINAEANAICDLISADREVTESERKNLLEYHLNKLKKERSQQLIY